MPRETSTFPPPSIPLTPFSHASKFAVLWYNFSGKRQGAFRYKNAPGEFQGAANAVKVDKQGNIYAVGFTTVSGLVVSFTSVGVQRWADRFGGSAGNPVALAIDQSGNIYAAGNGGHGGSDGVGPILEWVIVKYSSGGKVLWEQHHTGDPSLDSRITDIQLDSEGNPIVLRTTSNAPATLTNKMTVVKFNPHGETLWARDFAVSAQSAGSRWFRDRPRGQRIRHEPHQSPGRLKYGLNREIRSQRRPQVRIAR